VPTLLLVGDADPLIPVDVVRDAAALLPDARVQVFPGAAHRVMEHDPDGFDAAVRAFVG